MSSMYVIGEDRLSCRLGERLVEEVLGWAVPIPAIDKGGITKFVAALPRYAGLAQSCPVLCIADTDGGCALELVRRWRPAGAPPSLLLRLAVAEAESWLLADSSGLAAYLDIPEKKIPVNPDTSADPKLEVLKLAKRSRRREIRQEVVSSRNPDRPGVGYNLHLGRFAAQHWDPLRAGDRSPSLARTIHRLRAIAAADRSR